MPLRPDNVPIHEFKTAEMVVLGIYPGPVKIQGKRRGEPVVCPYCGSRVDVIPKNSDTQRSTAAAAAEFTVMPHLAGSSGRHCQLKIANVSVVFPDPGDGASQRRRGRIRARKVRGGAPRTPERPRRSYKEYDDIDELNGERRNHHWRNEYGIVAEGSAGVDYLGSEGGASSVRAFQGGRADGNRRRSRR